jgi:N-acetylglucosaminyldiphosphoundecaprenol N-acetyl-beta-D-mannosaminyltransferase
MEPRISLFGCDFDPVNLASALELVDRWIAERSTLRQAVGVNMDHLLKCNEEPRFASLVNRCDLVLADGQPVVWLSRRYGERPLPARVAVPDLMEAMFSFGDARGWRFYFLGAKDEQNAAAVENTRRRFPGMKIVGRHHGYYSVEDEPRIAADIAASGADVLLIAITSPKKEDFVDRNREALGPVFVMGVGGCFDILAGLHSRAPKLVRENGLEWAWRVALEPRRFGKRILHDLSFAKYMLRAERAGRGGGRPEGASGGSAPREPRP